tara:strand:- start:1686 stop:1847 length:162 start_codon:yes stop_codon:yes gene_type:complete
LHLTGIDRVLSGQNVDFQFVNGNVLELRSDNVAVFEAVWIPLRASKIVWLGAV